MFAESCDGCLGSLVMGLAPNKSILSSDRVPWRTLHSEECKAATGTRELVATNVGVAAAGLGKGAFTKTAQNLTTHPSTD